MRIVMDTKKGESFSAVSPLIFFNLNLNYEKIYVFRKKNK